MRIPFFGKRAASIPLPHAEPEAEPLLQEVNLDSEGRRWLESPPASFEQPPLSFANRSMLSIEDEGILRTDMPLGLPLPSLILNVQPQSEPELCAEARFETTQQDACAGIVLRALATEGDYASPAKPQAGYAALLSPDGKFALAKFGLSAFTREAKIDSWLIPWTSQSAFRAHDFNRLRFLEQNNRLGAYLNGALVGEAEAESASTGTVFLVSSGGPVLFRRISRKDPLAPAPFSGPPVQIEARCDDAIVMPNGVSRQGSWTFYLEAPQSWAEAPGLSERTKRVAERIYRGLNNQMQSDPGSDDGSRYRLHRVNAKIHKGPPGKPRYRLLDPGNRIEEIPD